VFLIVNHQPQRTNSRMDTKTPKKIQYT